MLQHNEYSRRGWLEVRRILSEFVHEGLTSEAARRRARGAPSGSLRGWSITRGPKFVEVDAIAWTMTVADLRSDTAEHYCEDVRRWSASVLADTKHLADLGDEGPPRTLLRRGAGSKASPTLDRYTDPDA
jgi:hypothetical protein